MPDLYRVVDWDKHYENNRTRSMKSMSWIPIPNSHDGDGYTQIMEAENGIEIFGCWILCVQVASRCRPRGTLLRKSGHPHDSQSLARLTRTEACIFAKALPKLLEIGWLEIIRQEGAGIRQEGVPLRNRTEGNRREGKGGKGRAHKAEELPDFAKKHPEYLELMKEPALRSITPEQYISYLQSFPDVDAAQAVARACAKAVDYPQGLNSPSAFVRKQFSSLDVDEEKAQGYGRDE